MTRRHSGFTLIEVMIVVAILGILAAIAIPSYMDYVDKAESESAAMETDDAQTPESQSGEEEREKPPRTDSTN
jgi:prepilin-type N-terminal cleavage/methylation domain-containing protein